MSAQDFSRERFSFTSDALSRDHALLVLRFHGTEGLSSLYSFNISLATQLDSLPLEDMLASRARFVIKKGDSGRDAVFSGYIGSIAQTSRYNDWTFYEVTLHPGLWYATKTVQNNFFIDKNVREILEQCLGKLERCCPKYEFRLAQEYLKQDFSMQNNETLYDYMAWKMERDGLYYFFEEANDGERLVITDSRLTHVNVEGVNPLRYSPGSGLENAHREEVIPSFSLTCTPLPKRVILREYDWLNPNRPVVGKSIVSENGMGDVYYYGEGFTSTEEGNRLANLRAESLRCQSRVFQGTSANPHLRPGFCFNLEGHYDTSFNREYLLTEVRHEGSQEAWLSQAIGVPIDNADRLYYRNSFSCVASNVQFRPQCRTERKKVAGMLTAFIDSSSDSAVAEVNARGCYKVVFPQDISENAPGKSSCWVRRMQPHVGKGHGFSFPLTPGVEVLIAFVDGNPDRPVIAGAMSNPESGFMENPSSAQAAAIQTPGGNGLAFNDMGTKQGLVLGTGGRSGLMMSSGSTDALLEFSDNAFESFTTSSLIEAGISHNLEAGFRQVIKADHGVFSNLRSNCLRGCMQAASGLEWGEKYVEPEEEEEKEEQKTSDILDGLSYSATVLKTLAQTVFTYDMAKEISESQYSAVLSSDDKKSELQLNTRVSAGDVAKYMGFWLFQVFPKFAFDSASLGVGVDGEEDVNKKRSMGRSYTAATAEALLAEVTALILLLVALRGERPKGMLIQSENGPIVSTTKKESIHLASKSMSFAAFDEAGDLASKKLSTPQTLPLQMHTRDKEISFRARTVKELASQNINHIAFNEITANARKIELSNKKEQAIVNEIRDFSGTFPELGNSGANYMSLSDTDFASISLENLRNSNNLILKNKKGSMTLDNEGTLTIKNKGTTLMENEADQNSSLIVRYKASAGGKQFSLSMDDRECKLGDGQSQGLSLGEDGSVELKNSQQSLSMQAGKPMTAMANEISLHGNSSVTVQGTNIKISANSDVTISAGAGKVKCTPALVQVG